jgi:hypothetical protein
LYIGLFSGSTSDGVPTTDVAELVAQAIYTPPQDTSGLFVVVKNIAASLTNTYLLLLGGELLTLTLLASESKRAMARALSNRIFFRDLRSNPMVLARVPQCARACELHSLGRYYDTDSAY